MGTFLETGWGGRWGEDAGYWMLDAGAFWVSSLAAAAADCPRPGHFPSRHRGRLETGRQSERQRERGPILAFPRGRRGVAGRSSRFSVLGGKTTPGQARRGPEPHDFCHRQEVVIEIWRREGGTNKKTKRRARDWPSPLGNSEEIGRGIIIYHIT